MVKFLSVHGVKQRGFDKIRQGQTLPGGGRLNRAVQVVGEFDIQSLHLGKLSFFMKQF